MGITGGRRRLRPANRAGTVHDREVDKDVEELQGLRRRSAAAAGHTAADGLQIVTTQLQIDWSQFLGFTLHYSEDLGCWEEQVSP